MGVSKDSYLGPYIIVTIPKAPKSFTKQVCGNKDCQSYNKELNSEFCPKCGSAREKTSYTKDLPAVDLQDLLAEDYKEKLTSVHLSEGILGKNDKVVISNHTSYRGDLSVPNEECAVSFASDLIEKDLDWFAIYFSKEIGDLVDKLGNNNVRIKWGLISYYS